MFAACQIPVLCKVLPIHGETQLKPALKTQIIFPVPVNELLYRDNYIKPRGGVFKTCCEEGDRSRREEKLHPSRPTGQLYPSILHLHRESFHNAWTY